MSRPCNELPERRCYQCGRVGVKAFVRERKQVGYHEITVYRCSNKGRCGTRGFDVQAGLQEFFRAFKAEQTAIAEGGMG